MIQQYLKGKLDREMMHQLEKKALDDPFLWDALEGYSNVSDPGANLSILQRQLHERIVHLQENKKVFDLTWQRLSVAAAAAVLFISAGILFWMNSSNTKSQIASNIKQVEVALTNPDSLNSVMASAEESPAAAKNKPLPVNNKNQTSAYNPPKETDSKLSRSTNLPKDKLIPADKAKIGADNSSSREEGDPASKPVLTAESARRTASVASSSRKEEVPNSKDAALNPVLNNGVQPLEGWELYNQFLKNNVEIPKNEPVLNGSVFLTLDVDQDGKISNVKVLKGLTAAYNLEAIRLVKEGPLWKGSADGQTKQGAVEVKF